MWFTIGFGASVALCAYAGFYPVVLILLAILAAAAAVAAFRWKKIRITAFVLAGAAAAMVFFLGYRAVYLQPTSEMDGTEQLISAEVTDYSYETDFGGAVEASIRMEGRQYRAVVYLDEYVHLIPGDRIEGLFRLRCTTGGREEATYHRGNGILLLCYPESELNILQTEQIPAKYYPAVLRRTLLAYIDGAFPADTACFAKALLLGEKSDLPYEISTAFKISGISHIIAVSGLHVSILFAIVTLITG
jgi:competence protein ComEC